MLKKRPHSQDRCRHGCQFISPWPPSTYVTAQAPRDFHPFQEMQRPPHLEEDSQERKALVRVQGWGVTVHPEGRERWCAQDS